MSSNTCPTVERLTVCDIPTSYLRPDSGFTFIPWIYSVIIVSLHIPLVVVRVAKWETAQWLALLMAIFSTGLIILEYQSTKLSAEEIYIWIPIVLAIDIGACMQVFLLVLERDGETLPLWNKLMTWMRWRRGRRVYEISLAVIDPNNGQHNLEETESPTPIPKLRTDRSTLSLHIVLALSLLFFLILLVLQLIGFVSACVGLHHAFENNTSESWCSPAFQLGSYVFDCVNNYTIVYTPATGVGCIQTRGSQSGYLKATIIVLTLEILFEIVDATLLIKAEQGQHIFGFSLLKLQRPWCTMIFGTGVWFAMIAIGVIRGKSGALPVNSHIVEIGGIGGSCKITLYGDALRGAIIAWSDGAFHAWGSTYDGLGDYL